MFEAAIWIGAVLFGLAGLGVIEYVRSNSTIRAHGETIKAVLPTLALSLLLLITGGLAMLFFFLYFLSGFWQFGIIIGVIIYVIIVLRIRQTQMHGALVAQPDLVGREQGASSTLFHSVASLAVQMAGAALFLLFMVPVFTGLYLFGFVLVHAAQALAAFWPHVLLVLATIGLGYYLLGRRRTPPPS